MMVLARRCYRDLNLKFEYIEPGPGAAGVTVARVGPPGGDSTELKAALSRSPQVTRWDGLAVTLSFQEGECPRHQ